MTLEDFVCDCARFGLEGTEPTSYYFPEDFDLDYLRNLKALAFRLGLDISGTAIRNDFCLPPGEEREREMAHVKQWIEYAEILNAPVIRVFSGKQQKGQTREEAVRLAIEGFEEACEFAGQHGVFLALENHGGLTATADGLLELVRGVQSPWFGVNFDSGNFHSQDPYEELERIAPYALNAQIKVAIKLADGTVVESDFKRLARMLTDTGYRGYVVLEYEESEDPREACPRYLDQLRDVFI
jgi:sugar phosphate isomerase/epimerase